MHKLRRGVNFINNSRAGISPWYELNDIHLRIPHPTIFIDQISDRNSMDTSTLAASCIYGVTLGLVFILASSLHPESWWQYIGQYIQDEPVEGDAKADQDSDRDGCVLQFNEDKVAERTAMSGIQDLLGVSDSGVRAAVREVNAVQRKRARRKMKNMAGNAGVGDSSSSKETNAKRDSEDDDEDDDESGSLDDMDLDEGTSPVKVLEWILVVLSLVGLAAYLQRTSGGEMSRELCAWFPREMETLGLCDLQPAVPDAQP